MKTIKIIALATIPNLLVSILLICITTKGDVCPTWVNIYVVGNLIVGLLLFLFICFKNGTLRVVWNELKVWINEIQ